MARLLRPMVVIDEGHHGYTENALKTLDGFNPGFLLELSATPRVASAKGSGLERAGGCARHRPQDAQMIKLPIHVDVQHWSDWQACLAASVERPRCPCSARPRRCAVKRARYIRPILLVQVERTGADTLDTGFIHAEHAKGLSAATGLHGRQIAVKTSEQNDLSAPENIDLLSPLCEVRAIITKQALQEGWDCPLPTCCARWPLGATGRDDSWWAHPAPACKPRTRGVRRWMPAMCCATTLRRPRW